MGNTPSSGNLPKDSGIVTVHAAPQGNEIEAWKAAFKQLPEVSEYSNDHGLKSRPCTAKAVQGDAASDQPIAGSTGHGCER